MKRLLLIILLLLCVFISAGSGTSYARTKHIIRFATVAPDGSTWVNAMRRLDERLRNRTGDRVGFRIYAGGIAGDEIDVIRKIRLGQLHCAAFSGVGITEILPMWRVLDLPFLFRDMEEIELVHSELRDLFADEFRKAGFEYLSWAEVGDIHLFSKREIKSPEDLKGLRVWTWSGDPVSRTTFTSMNVTPIPLSVTDVNTALSTNMIDTVYAPVLGALAMQWHSQVQHMTALPITHSTGAILISSKFYDNIPDDLKEIVRSEVDLAMNELTAELVRQAEESIEIIEKSGINIIPVPEGRALDEFYALHEKVAAKLKGSVFPETLLARIYKILEEHRLSK